MVPYKLGKLAMSGWPDRAHTDVAENIESTCAGVGITPHTIPSVSRYNHPLITNKSGIVNLTGAVVVKIGGMMTHNT